MTLCGVKEGQKVGISPVSFFLIDPPFNRKKPFLRKVVLFARRSATEKNKIARSFGGERNRIARRFSRKGIGLLVDPWGKEQTSLIWDTASRSV